jgi:TonB-dependent starch-binding outer membrane protein SusC
MKKALHRITVLLLVFGLAHPPAWAQLLAKAGGTSGQPAPEVLSPAGQIRLLKLNDALTILKKQHKVDILCFAKAMEKYEVPVQRLSPSLSLEENLDRVLSPLNLRYRKSSNGGYVITEKKRTGRESKPTKSSTAMEPSPSTGGPASSSQVARLPLVFKPQLISRGLPNLTISGTVTGSDNDEPLPGVNILIKGTQTGTTTDQNGSYSLQVMDEDAILVYSFVGYLAQEVKVGNRVKIDVSLQTDTKALSEVVVVGYGTMNKRDLTGAVAKVNVEQMSEMSNVSILQSLQGAAPGLNVGNVTTAGSDPTISIRGQNTLSSSAGDNAPLVVVDGIIYRGSIVDINPSNIESIEVLKDASSASIYGSQAANGVILVTTKKGRDFGKPIISYSGQYSLQTPTKNIRPFDAAGEKAFLDDVFWEQSRVAPDYLTSKPGFSVLPFLKTLDISEGYESGRDIDWWGMLTGNGHITSHDLSIRGGTQNTSYFVTTGVTDQKGFIKNDLYRRFSTRANFNTKITNWLDFGFESFVTNSDYSGVSPNVNILFYMQPFSPIYDKDGEYTLQPDGSQINPFLQQQIKDSDKRLNLFGNFHTDIKLPFLAGFNYRINFSHNYRTTNQNRFDQWGANFTGSGYKNSYIFYDRAFDNILSYKKNLGTDHRIDLTVVYGVEKRNFSQTEVSAQGFSNPVLGYNKLEAGDPALNNVDTGAEQETSLYTMGRFLYSLKDKYLITATVRRDGFSGFGTKKKLGVFPSLALGWIVSDEAFFKNNLVDYLKLRASYGTTARRAVGRYQTLATISSGPSRVFGDGGTATIGQSINKLANDNLGWETTTGMNLGADFELFKSRLRGNVEYYTNNTRDILYDIQIPNITGFSTISTNIGKVYNYGLEFSLTGNVIRRNDFSWSVTGNFARNRNRIKSILGADNDGDGKEDDIVTNQLFIGQPQNVVFDYEIIGMWQLADKESQTIPSGFFPGTYKIADQNGDGLYSPADRKILGYRDPSYRFSIANTFNYKSFSLYVFINSIQGGKNYYLANGSPQASGSLYKRDQLSYSNAFQWDYWLPENPNAKYRRLDLPSQFDTNPYDQRSFVRLQDVSLAYNFKTNILEKLKMRNLKLYLSGKNLMTLTKWEGWDPETGVGLTAGLPVQRSYTMGINVEF